MYDIYVVNYLVFTFYNNVIRATSQSHRKGLVKAARAHAAVGGRLRAGKVAFEYFEISKLNCPSSLYF